MELEDRVRELELQTFNLRKALRFLGGQLNMPGLVDNIDEILDHN